MARGYLRRKDKAMSIEEIEQFLAEEQVGRLASVGEDGWPYVIPLNYTFFNGQIIFHSAAGGHKLDNIAFNSRVCFVIDKCYDLVENRNPCEFSVRYKSVVVFGTARFVAAEEKKKEYLEAFIKKYALHGEVQEMASASLARTIVIAVNIEMLTGKKSGL
ncbi:MAG: pyridoxamine 5'-phosphate oxidase family protein [Bacillota bacterium]